MNSISVRQARRELSRDKIKEWGECEITSDGEVIATLNPTNSPVRQTNHDVNKAEQPVRPHVGVMITKEMQLGKKGMTEKKRRYRW